MSFQYDETPACSTIGDPDYFFPDSPKDIRERLPLAKKICDACPVLAACSMYALNTPGLVGIWAGKYYMGLGYISPVDLSRKAS